MARHQPPASALSSLSVTARPSARTGLGAWGRGQLSSRSREPPHPKDGGSCRCCPRPDQLHSHVSASSSACRRMLERRWEVTQVGTLAARNCHSVRSEEHTSELQSLMRTSYAVFCLKKKTHQ